MDIRRTNNFPCNDSKRTSLLYVSTDGGFNNRRSFDDEGFASGQKLEAPMAPLEYQ